MAGWGGVALKRGGHTCVPPRCSGVSSYRLLLWLPHCTEAPPTGASPGEQSWLLCAHQGSRDKWGPRCGSHRSALSMFILRHNHRDGTWICGCRGPRVWESVRMKLLLAGWKYSGISQWLYNIVNTPFKNSLMCTRSYG